MPKATPKSTGIGVWDVLIEWDFHSQPFSVIYFSICANNANDAVNDALKQLKAELYNHYSLL